MSTEQIRAYFFIQNVYIYLYCTDIIYILLFLTLRRDGLLSYLKRLEGPETGRTDQAPVCIR